MLHTTHSFQGSSNGRLEFFNLAVDGLVGLNLPKRLRENRILLAYITGFALAD